MVWEQLIPFWDVQTEIAGILYIRQILYQLDGEIVWYLPLVMRTTILPSQRTGLLFPQTIMRVPKLRWMSLQCQYNEGMFPTESGTIQFHSAPHSPYNDVWILWKYSETNMISIQSSSLEGTLDPWTAYKYHTCIETCMIYYPTKNVESPSYNHLQKIHLKGLYIYAHPNK